MTLSLAFGKVWSQKSEALQQDLMGEKIALILCSEAMVT